ncbi:hypothetical protein C8T65DRAFT_655563 [Cerioporus squamosus]|nr:hypothetical protein C8T65DRAFT_655563 [Cerioporus squamosus]
MVPQSRAGKKTTHCSVPGSAATSFIDSSCHASQCDSGTVWMPCARSSRPSALRTDNAEGPYLVSVCRPPSDMVDSDKPA